MKKYIFPAVFIIVVSVLSSLSSCKVNIIKNGDEDTTTVTKTFDFQGFDEIDCAGAANIHFMVSDTFSVKVVASKSQLERLEVKLKGKQLSIGEKSHKNIHIINFKVNGRDDYEVYISAPTLRGIDIAGSMDFECADTIKTDKMNIDIAGSADVRMKNLQSEKTTVDIAGSADVDINFIDSGSADIDIAGSGDVTLSGKLKSITKDIAGSGDIDTSKLKLGE